ncbi:MAG: PAS domain-containing protein [Nitrospinae bacterium]|nr:PAS domain-containing protein [Nitrospinota bacterium]
MAEKRAQKVFVTALAVVLIAMAGIAFLFNRLGRSIESYMTGKFTEEQLLLARQIKGHIEDKFHSTENQLETYRRIFELEGIPARLAAGRWNGQDAWITALVKTDIGHLLMQNPIFVRFAVTDAKGYPVLYVQNIGGVPRTVYAGKPIKTDDDGFQPVGERMGQPKALISAPHEVKLHDGVLTSRPRLIDVSVPLMDGPKTAGRVILSLDMAYLATIISGNGGANGTDHRWLFDENGNLVYCSLIMSQEYHDEEIRYLAGKPIGSYELSSHTDGSRDLLSVVPLEIGDNRWTLVAEAGLDDVIGLVRNLRLVRAVILFVLTLLAGAGALVLYRNTMRRVAAEEKSRLMDQISAEEEKYRRLIELAPDPIFLLDTGLRIADYNSIAAFAFGKEGKELLGQHFEELVGNKEELLENIRLIGEGKEGNRLVHTIASAGGRTFHFEDTTAIIKTSGGQVYYQNYLRNVTERIELENRLRQEKENLDRIVGSLGAGLAIFNHDMQMEWANSRYREFAARMNYRLTGERCFICANAEAGDCIVQLCLATRSFQKAERTYIVEGGQMAHYLIAVTPLKEPGSADKAVEMIIDVTESKNMEAQLLQSEKLASIGELASGIAHELNNPMAGIIGYSELLMDDLKEQEGPRRDAERIHGEAIRCSKIIQNLLTFARRHKPQKGEISLNDVLEATIDIVDYEFKVNNVVMKKEYAPNLKLIIGDHYQMQQVFLNILNNAFFYLKDKPGARYIIVTTRNSARGAQVTIKNNGPKIDPAIIGKVFDPFFTTKEVGKGTGLGLSVSHGIIVSHKGELTVTNVEDGVMFTVDLPPAPGQETA